MIHHQFHHRTMKFSNALTILLVVVLSVTAAFAQSGFEGVITFRTTNAAVNETATVVWSHKKGQYLMEFDSKAGEYHLTYSMIMGTNDGTVFSKSDKGGIQEIFGITAEEVFTAAKFVRKMKTTENGYDCEMLMFKSNGNDLTYWMTSGIGISYGDLPKVVRNNMPNLSGISNGFPLKMELRGPDGTLLRSQEVVSVVESKVDDSKFDRK
jgi:hypothetical protein